MNEWIKSTENPQVCTYWQRSSRYVGLQTQQANSKRTRLWARSRVIFECRGQEAEPLKEHAPKPKSWVADHTQSEVCCAVKAMVFWRPLTRPRCRSPSARGRLTPCVRSRGVCNWNPKFRKLYIVITKKPSYVNRRVAWPVAQYN